MKRFLFATLFMVLSITVNSQENINDYKYIVVPESYDIFKGSDTYQLNSLTKFLFNKNGFKAFMQTDKLPDDLRNNGCKKLSVSVKKGSSLFVTKLTIYLTNCNGVVVYTTSEGSTREKDYKKAYQMALRNAFKDIESLNYKYNGSKEGSEEVASIKPVAKQEELPAAEKVTSVPEITPEKKNETKISAPSNDEVAYVFNNKEVVLKKQEYGFELLQKENNTLVPAGKVYKMTRDNSYLVKAGDLSGAGYFDGYGNFILERINPATNKLITDTLARQ